MFSRTAGTAGNDRTPSTYITIANAMVNYNDVMDREYLFLRAQGKGFCVSLALSHTSDEKID